MRLVRAGLAFGVTGVLGTAPFVLDSEPRVDALRALALPAFAAAALVGASCWGVLCAPGATRARAAIAGAVFGVGYHIPAVLLAMLSADEWFALSTGAPQVGGLVGATLFVSFFTLLSYGWLTVALGIATGLLLERFNARTR